MQVNGLDTDIPDGMKPNARTIAALHMLENRTRIVKLQYDDGPLDLETHQQLSQIADDVGYRYIRLRNTAYLFAEDEVPEV
jgi:hypothetical protein